MASGGRSRTPAQGAGTNADSEAGGWSQVARLLLGGAYLALGVAWGLGDAPRVTGIVMGVVMAAGGLVLLLTRRFRLPARSLWAVVAGTVLLGALAGLTVRSTAMGGMYGYTERRGFPFAWLTRGAVADDADAARQAAEAAAWQVGVAPLLGTVVVYAAAGILVLVLALALRRHSPRGEKDQKRSAQSESGLR